uniref:Cadherin EGF LAG seven-pass G-type receptor 2-like n=1 Tax=Saccoglossus kowalevskii TaxID=10224 RepID=A0ABM0MCS5_SACKO|nr:PREDICTED: cadherin EGF LAG seven-pass G-type receptor 2-like [Saccoglossus kowalevskii]
MTGFQLLVLILVIPYCLCVPHITNLPKTIIMNEGTPANEILYSLEVDTTGATVVNDNPSVHFDFDDSTLVVTAGTVVNYDEIPGQVFLQSYRLDFTITDGADSSIGYLTIQIRDQPDTAPWFGTTYYEPTGTPPTYNALMNEEQSTIFWTAFPPSVEVNDPDGNDLYSLTYSLGGASSVFTVDSSTGTISATSNLDFETDTQTYLFDLIATDPSGLAGTCSVSVSLVDLNDNSPIFDQGIYLTEVQEHDGTAGHTEIVVQTVTAVDIDAGAAITYALVGGDDAPPNSKFYLAGNIIRTTASLDYEDPVVIGRNYQYDLIVTASDVGSPSVATATVRVKVGIKSHVLNIFIQVCE